MDQLKRRKVVHAGHRRHRRAACCTLSPVNQRGRQLGGRNVRGKNHAWHRTHSSTHDNVGFSSPRRWNMADDNTIHRTTTTNTFKQPQLPQQRHQQQLSELSNGTVCQQPISCSVTILRQIITREGIFTGLAQTGQAKESTNLCRTVGVRRSTSTLHPATVGRG